MNMQLGQSNAEECLVVSPEELLRLLDSSLERGCSVTIHGRTSREQSSSLIVTIAQPDSNDDDGSFFMKPASLGGISQALSSIIDRRS